MNEEEILGAFLLVNDYRILTNEELEDVKKAINNLQQKNTILKQQLKDKDEKISKATQYLEKNFYYCLASGDNINHYIDELIDYLNDIKDIKIVN